MSSPPKSRPRWGPLRSLLCLSPLVLVVLYAYRLNYDLPQPVTEPYDPSSGLPQLSEANALAHAKYLSEEIGYRTVGTREHALGDEWMVAQAKRLHTECEEIVRAQPGRNLECEVWHQRGSGTHRFDMMGRRLYKIYGDLTNIVIRVSDGTEAGKEHAVLVNSHVDSTLPSPGAADDAISVGIMMECVRVLINTPGWEPTHAIVFLFNNAEESLQDGSHLFSTQHPIAPTVRAVINLEAAGTTGKELLFQATSEQMIRAYSQVPRPYGTIIANEVFSSGVILSDTDFRQFEQYLNVTGLDIAIIGNSYLYHMRKDLVENIEPGVTQHMGDNVLALLRFLSAPGSPLPELTEGYTRPTTVFYQLFDYFIIYSFQTALAIYVTLFVSSLILAKITYANPAPGLKNGGSMLGEYGKGVLAVATSCIGAVLGANVVALLMKHVLGKGMSWFARPMSCVLLYGPAALAGALASQLIAPRAQERKVFTSLLLVQGLFMCIGQFAGIGSAALFFTTCVGFFVSLSVDAFTTDKREAISLVSYFIGQFIPLSIGTQVFCTTLDVFVPLTGRIGEEAPAEHIIASIVAGAGAYTLPLVVPFVHRFGRRVLIRAVILSSAVTALAIIVFSARSPFDAMHQKRLFVMHMENITSAEQHLHFAVADGAPGYPALVQKIAQRFGVEGIPAQSTTMDDWNTYWEPMYPFSEFLTPYNFELPVLPEYLEPLDHRFTVTAANDIIDTQAGTRSLTLVINHPGTIWTAIVFDAHVLKWSLDENPPDEFARHHVKEVSFYGHDTYTVDLVIKLQPNEAEPGLKVSFVGIHEKAMWPGKRAEKAEGGRAMVLFEEFDEWIEKETEGAVDTLLIGGIGGYVVV